MNEDIKPRIEIAARIAKLYKEYDWAVGEYESIANDFNCTRGGLKLELSNPELVEQCRHIFLDDRRAKLELLEAKLVEALGE